MTVRRGRPPACPTNHPGTPRVEGSAGYGGRCKLCRRVVNRAWSRRGRLAKGRRAAAAGGTVEAAGYHRIRNPFGGDSVWTYKAMPPFVRSGVGAEGVLFHSSDFRRVMCHDCGEWFEFLGQHVRCHGGAESYKQRHGFRRADALAGMALRMELIRRGRERLEPLGRAHRFNGLQSGPGGARRSKALLNERNICDAQLLEDLRELVIRLGRSPVLAECSGFGRRTAYVYEISQKVAPWLESQRLAHEGDKAVARLLGDPWGDEPEAKA